MQKKVAVRYGFRCALCNEPLDETWETDHIIPLNEARNLEDAQILNGIEIQNPKGASAQRIAEDDGDEDSDGSPLNSKKRLKEPDGNENIMNRLD